MIGLSVSDLCREGFIPGCRGINKAWYVAHSPSTHGEGVLCLFGATLFWILMLVARLDISLNKVPLWVASVRHLVRGPRQARLWVAAVKHLVGHLVGHPGQRTPLRLLYA